jgi:hypothetical protein
MNVRLHYRPALLPGFNHNDSLVRAGAQATTATGRFRDCRRYFRVCWRGEKLNDIFFRRQSFAGSKQISDALGSRLASTDGLVHILAELYFITNL